MLLTETPDSWRDEGNKETAFIHKIMEHAHDMGYAVNGDPFDLTFSDCVTFGGIRRPNSYKLCLPVEARR